MRVPPPAPLRLDRQALLAEVRAQLGERLPEWTEGAADDPTEPAWLLLEQVAWMVELLSEQLDRYPFAVLQQVVHQMGGGVRPAVPALGAVVVLPAARGTIEQVPERPERVRFFAPQTEQRDAVAFVPVERAVDVRPGGIVSLTRIEGGALQRVGSPGADPLAQRRVAVGAPVAARVFADEEIAWSLVGARAEELVERVQAAIDALGARAVGWLRLSVAETDDGRVRVTAVVDPDEALLAEVPEGLAPGGDLEIPWGRLDDTTWTPPTRVADRASLPLAVRRSRPLPGDREGRLLVPALPPDEPLRGLLERVSTPIPRAVAAAVWRTLVAQDESLARLRPEARHGVAPRRAARSGEPGWVDAALGSGRWPELAREGRTLAEVRLAPEGLGAGAVRVGLLLPPGVDRAPPVSALGLEAGALQEAPSPCRPVWELAVPPVEAGHRLQRLVAYDVTLDDAADGLLLCVDGPVSAVYLDVLLVVNAPAIEDRREIVVERAAPEAVALLAEDIVGRDAMDALEAAPLAPSTRAALAALPLAWADVHAKEAAGAVDAGPLRDFEGVTLDASRGVLTLNGPDATGALRRLRPGAAIDLRWYRRTDGALGRVDAGAITQVDQGTRATPRLLGVVNPVGTVLGADREQDEDAVRRLFAGAGGAPVVPSDWERAIRRELGPRAAGWIVRCWSHAERVLLPRARWGGADDALVGAGPETLLVVLGPTDAPLDDEGLDQARLVVDALVGSVRKRLPTIRRAVVTRCWALTLEGSLGPDTPLPTMELTGAQGVLVDALGRRSALPASRLLLDACVVRVVSAPPPEARP